MYCSLTCNTYYHIQNTHFVSKALIHCHCISLKVPKMLSQDHKRSTFITAFTINLGLKWRETGAMWCQHFSTLILNYCCFCSSSQHYQSSSCMLLYNRMHCILHWNHLISWNPHATASIIQIQCHSKPEICSILILLCSRMPHHSHSTLYNCTKEGKRDK